MTDPEPLKIEIQGDRFKGGQLPTEFLGDLEQLGKAIVEQAKAIYLRNNPNKQRVPRGFEEYIRPTITGLRTGSAVIDLNRPKREARLGDTQELFIPFEEEQVEAIRETLELLKGTKSATEPKSIATRLLKRVGAGLKDGESMRLSTGIEEVSYDRERRQEFLFRNFPGESTTEPGKLTGIIHAVDMEKSVFQIRLSITEINVTGVIPAEQQDYIIDKLKAYQRTNRVTLSGDVTYESTGKPKSISNIWNIEASALPQIAEQIEEIRNLSEGWLTGGEELASPEGLDWAVQILERELETRGEETPMIFPTADGNIRLEWEIGESDISLDVDLKTREGYYHWYKTNTKMDFEKEYELEATESWEQIRADLASEGDK